MVPGQSSMEQPDLHSGGTGTTQRAPGAQGRTKTIRKVKKSPLKSKLRLFAHSYQLGEEAGADWEVFCP